MTALASPPAPAPATADREVVVRIPVERPLVPPVTARRILRWTLVWAAAAAIAVAALALSAPDWVRVLTVGLPTPGGAFFATGAPIAGLATLLLLGISFFFWWAFGPTVLPPIVWVAAAAVGAATRSTPPVESATLLTAAAPALLGLGGLAIHLLRAGAQRRRGAALNEQLAAAPVRITGAPEPRAPRPLRSRRPRISRTCATRSIWRCSRSISSTGSSSTTSTARRRCATSATCWATRSASRDPPARPHSPATWQQLSAARSRRWATAACGATGPPRMRGAAADSIATR